MITLYRNTPVFLVVLALCVDVQALSAQDVMLPEEIREALARNAKQLSPITVSLTDQYHSSLLPKEVIEKLKINTNSYYFFAKKPRRVIWQNGRIYCWRRKTEKGNGPDGQEYENSFDGQIIYNGTPNATLSDGSHQPKLTKESVSLLAKTKPDTQYLNTGYFDVTGLRLPACMKELQANKSGSEILLLLESGGRLSAVEDTELDGRRATRIELVAENPERRMAEKLDLFKVEKDLRSAWQPERFIQQELAALKQMRDLPETRVYVFYLDSKMQYAVRRREERYEDGTLLLQANNNEFEQLQGREVWLPRSSTVDYYTWTSIPGTYFKSPVLSHVIEVSEFGLDPVPDKQFVLNYTDPGTIITDYMAPEGPFTYQIPADKFLLDAALESIQFVSDIEKVPSVSVPPMERGLEGAQPQAKSPEPRVKIPAPVLSHKDWDWPFVILLNAIALITLSVLAVWRYKRRGVADEM